MLERHSTRDKEPRTKEGPFIPNHLDGLLVYVLELLGPVYVLRFLFG